MTGKSKPTILPVFLAKFPEQEITCSHSICPLFVSTIQVSLGDLLILITFVLISIFAPLSLAPLAKA